MRNGISNYWLQTFIVFISVLAGCTYLQSTPFDYPTYPKQAVEVTSIKDYQNNISTSNYSVYDRKTMVRFATQHLAVQAHYLYVAQCGLTIFDISNPDQISMVGDYDDICGVDDLVITDKRVYLAARDSGVVVVDIADPTRPTLIASYIHRPRRDAPPASIIVADNYIYLYAPISKLSACHLSRPKAECERHVGWHLETPVWKVLRLEPDANGFRLHHVKDVAEIGRPRAASGNYIYAASAWQTDPHTYVDKLQVVDITNREFPEAVDEQIVTNIVDLQIYDHTLWGSTGNGIRAWNINDPCNPQPITMSDNALGIIGDFSTLDVDSARVVGKGYTLKYHHTSKSTLIQIDSTFGGAVGNAVIKNGYIYSPSYTATDGQDAVLTGLKVRVYKLQ